MGRGDAWQDSNSELHHESLAPVHVRKTMCLECWKASPGVYHSLSLRKHTNIFFFPDNELLSSLPRRKTPGSGKGERKWKISKEILSLCICPDNSLRPCVGKGDGKACFFPEEVELAGHLKYDQKLGKLLTEKKTLIC